jgi:hypothetical protein
MDIRPTAWFPLDRYAPVRDGWYEVQLVSGDTAFAKFGANEWSEKPLLVFTHWRGLSADPARSGESETFSAEATAAEGVRAAWHTTKRATGEEACLRRPSRAMRAARPPPQAARYPARWRASHASCASSPSLPSMPNCSFSHTQPCGVTCTARVALTRRSKPFVQSRFIHCTPSGPAR